MNIPIKCTYQMFNATRGQMTCSANASLDLTILWVTLSIIALFTVWRMWLYTRELRNEGENND